MKEKEDLKKELEAVLFAAGRKVTVDELAKICNSDRKGVEDAVKELKHEYEQKNSPLLLTEEVDGFKLTVREKYLSVVKEVTPHTELNRAMMETLAVIAWKQPVMQAEVIKIRTSKAYEDVKSLVEMGFISKEKHGRSFILKPTGKFFEYFDLPGKDAVKEIFKDVKDVEPETQQKIGDLEVYEAPAQKKEGENEEGEECKPTEKLDGLEVFTEPEKTEEESEETEAVEEEEAEETENKSEEKEESGENPEDSGEESGEELDEEEKARKFIHRLVEEDDKDEEDKQEEESDDDSDDEAEEDSAEQKKGKKKRLPKELEDFAGIEEEKDKEESGKENDEDNS